MPKLKANFEADWVAHLRKILVSDQGWSEYEISNFDDREVRCCYYDAQRRRISALPRIIRIADDFQCPPDYLNGWTLLQGKILQGADINPHLSINHMSPLFSDGLLNDWNVHHFHLGTTLHPRNQAYTARTGLLLFAFVSSRFFCAINVYNHQSFEDVNVIESIHRNWPEALRHYRIMSGVSAGMFEPDMRRKIRKANGNILTRTADGTAYGPIGGGVMANGVAPRAMWLADYWQIRIRALQVDFEGKIDDLLPVLKRQGYADEAEIEAELRLAQSEFQIFFPKYSVICNII